MWGVHDNDKFGRVRNGTRSREIVHQTGGLCVLGMGSFEFLWGDQFSF